MKKTVLIIIAGLIFANVSSVKAQTYGSQRPYRQMRIYITQNVLPFIKTQKELLTSSLSGNEKEELKKIEEDLKTFREQGKQIRESMKGNYNQSMADLRKKSYNEIVARADTLLAHHPDAVSAYKKAYFSEKEKWEKEMTDIMPYAKGGNAAPKRNIVAMLENPSYVLLWDENNNFWKAGAKNPKHAVKTRAGNKTFRAEKREKIMKYAETNIVPVIEKEQNEFKKTLTKKELKTIEKAQQIIASRKAVMPAMRRGYMYKPQTDDSTRLAMQIEMQKAMLPVKELALKHYAEIEKHLNTIRENIPQWRKDMIDIIGARQDTVKLPPFIRYKIKRIDNPETFLLFDKTFFENKIKGEK